jgi:Animal haem peroxidase
MGSHSHEQTIAGVQYRRRRLRLLRRAAILACVGALGLSVIGTADAGTQRQRDRALERFEMQSLDGSGNNVADPDRGKVGTQYARLTATRYADGLSNQSADRAAGSSATGSSTTRARTCFPNPR